MINVPRCIPAAVTLILVLFLQTATAQTSVDQHKNTSVKPSLGMIIFITIIITTIFLTAAFSIYIHFFTPYSSTTSNHMTLTPTISAHSHITSIPSSHIGQGLDPSILITFPSFTYSEVKSHKLNIHSLECAVCLEEFIDDDVIKLLPICDHVFHLDCIDAWLRSHTTCPVCRADLGSVSDPDYSSAHEVLSLLRWSSGDTIRTSSDLAQNDSEIDRRRRWWGSRTRSLSMLGGFFSMKFGRSNSTENCLVRPGDDLNRFTLRLPREIRNQLLNRSASDLVLPTVSSMRNGYRTRGRGRRNGSLERVVGVEDRWWMFGFGSSLFRKSWCRTSSDGSELVKYNSSRPVL